MSRVSLGCSLTIFCAMLLASGSIAGQNSNIAPRIDFEHPPHPEKGDVTFYSLRVKPDRDLPNAESEDEAIETVLTDGQGYIVTLDRRDIQFHNDGYFYFDVSVIAREKAGQAPTRYYFKYRPSGIFADYEDDIPFQFFDGKSRNSGHIVIPLHPRGTDNFLDIEKDHNPELGDGPAPVGVSRPVNLPQISVLSRLDYGLKIISVKATSASCALCWGSLSAADELKNEILPPSEGTHINIAVVPTAGQALLQTAKRLKINEPHDTISLEIKYAPLYGGRDRTQTFQIPIRFTPTLSAIVAACLLGMVLGVLLKLVPAVASEKITVQTFVYSALSVTVCEVALAFGVSQDSRPLVFFGVNVDPMQILPAFFTALVVSGGASVVQLLRKIITDAMSLIRQVFSPATGLPPENG